MAEETERAASGLAFDRLFEGSTREMADRWAGTAVLDRAGKWHVVQAVDPVQDVAPKRRVKLFSGGSFGRGRFQDADCRGTPGPNTHAAVPILPFRADPRQLNAPTTIPQHHLGVLMALHETSPAISQSRGLGLVAIYICDCLALAYFIQL